MEWFDPIGMVPGRRMLHLVCTGCVRGSAINWRKNGPAFASAFTIGSDSARGPGRVRASGWTVADDVAGAAIRPATVPRALPAPDPPLGRRGHAIPGAARSAHGSGWRAGGRLFLWTDPAARCPPARHARGAVVFGGTGAHRQTPGPSHRADDSASVLLQCAAGPGDAGYDPRGSGEPADHRQRCVDRGSGDDRRRLPVDR